MITKLTQAWQAERRAFAARDLSGIDYKTLHATTITPGRSLNSVTTGPAG